MTASLTDTRCETSEQRAEVFEMASLGLDAQRGDLDRSLKLAAVLEDEHHLQRRLVLGR